MYNIALLDKALDHIKANPETWNQNSWRCGTGMCLAGWVVTLAGRQWLNPEATVYADRVVADATNEKAYTIPDYVRNELAEQGVRIAEGTYFQWAAEAADQLLGITDDCHGMYDGENTLDDLIAYRDRMAAGQEPGWLDDDECW